MSKAKAHRQPIPDWRRVVAELYEKGSLISAKVFSTIGDVGSALAQADKVGAVQSPGRCGRELRPWHLTKVGFLIAENRMEMRPRCAPPGLSHRLGRNRLVPTWIAPLPKAGETWVMQSRRRAPETECVEWE